MTTAIDFDEWTNMLTDFREKKVIKHNDDQVYLVCGDEGTGKSTFSIATASEVYRKSPDISYGLQDHHICFEHEKWEQANLEVACKKMLQGSPGNVKKIAGEMGLSVDDIEKIVEDSLTNEADILVDDEAGTEAHARESLKNVDFIKTMIRNRFLNLQHFMNVPKPESIDTYIRKQRTKLMIWCDAEYTDNLEQRLRTIYVYPKDQYIKILYKPKWWLMFSSTKTLIRHNPPPIVIQDLPDLNKFIDKDLRNYYTTKKAAYCVKTLLEIKKNRKEDNKEKHEASFYLVREGEDSHTWSERTGKLASSYKDYVNKAYNPDVKKFGKYGRKKKKSM